MGQETSIVDSSFEWSERARVPGTPERDALLNAHAPLVKYVARRIASRLAANVDVDELISDGMLGLLEATERFDPGRDVLFKTYAENRVRGAILDGIRNRDWAPRSLRRAARKLESAIEAVEARSGGPASEEEICKELHLDTESLHRLYVKAKGIRLQSLGGEDDAPVPDDDPFSSPLTRLELGERTRLLAKPIDGLPERETLVLSLYYEKQMSLREIGELLGVTESRICQIQTRAIARLRVWVAREIQVPEYTS